MANVQLSWTANDAIEQVTKYNVYQDGTKVLEVASSPALLPNVVPGVRQFQVAPVNLWGEGPKSDPVVTPPAASKVVVTVLVQVP